MIPKSVKRFSDEVMLKQKSYSVMAIRSQDITL
jgi:hypothetical protein